jgi:hypothetical protein
MSVVTDVGSRVSRVARAQKENYSGGAERPLAVTWRPWVPTRYAWLQEQEQL